MKLRLPTLLSLSLTPLFVIGCATTTTTTADNQRKDVEITSEKRSYSKRELEKRGRFSVADSLEAQDASVRIDRR